MFGRANGADMRALRAGDNLDIVCFSERAQLELLISARCVGE